MKINKLQFLNLLRDGISIDIERFNIEEYKKAIKDIKSIITIIEETEENYELLGIDNIYYISSIENKQVIDGMILDDFDIITYLLDDKTLSFIISTELLTFLSIDENFENIYYIEDKNIYACDNEQFIKLLNLCINSLEYELEEIFLKDSLVDICVELNKNNNALSKKISQEEYFDMYEEEQEQEIKLPDPPILEDEDYEDENFEELSDEELSFLDKYEGYRDQL